MQTQKCTHPVNILAHVEYAVTACSCSPSNANVCANATHAGPNRGSMSEVLEKYWRAWLYLDVERYHTPTAYLGGD